ncbi:DMT family transporter [Priestia abyssalis]|uniref:DMT family transporter n=1 Tax=Priestia abyssalis TaxID=1221450 RepID=UPI000994CC80|nr:SMR family transporter [Priestia abyssalis]
MNWLLVFIAGVMEVAWASGLKHADSFGDWAITTALIVVSFMLLIRSYRTIPIAAAYTVFVGIGTVGTYAVGILLGEPYSMKQLFFVLILLAGVVGMKIFTQKNDKKMEGEQE